MVCYFSLINFHFSSSIVYQNYRPLNFNRIPFFYRKLLFAFNYYYYYLFIYYLFFVEFNAFKIFISVNFCSDLGNQKL